MARKSPRTRGVDAMSKISNGEGRGWGDGGAVESEVVRVSEPNVVMLTMLTAALQKGTWYSGPSQSRCRLASC